MTKSNVQPVYPNGIFPWTDRVDNSSVDFANDINSTVAEVESIETILGTNPQVEVNPPTGTSISYSSVSSRITDAMNNANLPVCSLSAASQKVGNATAANINKYRKNYDPFKMHNGTDISIPVSGWYVIGAHQQWPWWNQGYTYTALCLNGTGNIVADFLIDWTFSGNTANPKIESPDFIIQGQSPQGTPRWQKFGKRARIASISWDGLLHKGDRISVTSENGTSSPNFTVSNMFLTVACAKTIPSTVSFSSG